MSLQHPCCIKCIKWKVSLHLWCKVNVKAMNPKCQESYNICITFNARFDPLKQELCFKCCIEMKLEGRALKYGKSSTNLTLPSLLFSVTSTGSESLQRWKSSSTRKLWDPTLSMFSFNFIVYHHQQQQLGVCQDYGDGKPFCGRLVTIVVSRLEVGDRNDKR